MSPPQLGHSSGNSSPTRAISFADAVAWKEHASLDALHDRFILLRVYGSEGLVFGFEATADR